MIDVLVVGGGLAGSAAALRLARSGLEVTVVERDPAPRPKVCGEFLAAPALAELGALGIDAAALGAVPVGHLTLSHKARCAVVRLPFRAQSLTRERLDAALLQAAKAAGATVRFGESVTGLRQCADAWAVTLRSGEQLAARDVVVASGKWDIRDRPRGRGLHNDLVGLKAAMRLSRRGHEVLGRSVDVVLYDGGYCGIEATEGLANVCLVVPAARLKSERPEVILRGVAGASARAADLLDGAALAGPVRAIARIPYGFVRRSTDGAYHIGDQAAVIPSFCGEGMGLALVSARRCAEAILAGTPAGPYQAAFARDAAPRVTTAALLSHALCAAPLQAPLVMTTAAWPSIPRVFAAAIRTPAGV